MSTTNMTKLPIDDKAYGYAKIYASLLSDQFQRKRAYASILALYSFLNILERTPYDIQKAMTLFRNPVINEQYEISDIYVNDWHLDVRVVTGGNAVLIPKIHYDANIVPDFYIIVKVDSELKNAELVGIADTSKIDKEAFDYHYYSVAFDSLISYDEFLNKIQTKKRFNFKPEEHELFRECYLGLMDNEIDIQNKNKILRHLFECDECRTEFCCFTGFEMVSCNASKYPELLEDQTLSIIGAQSVNDKKYEGKEETIYLEDKIEDEESIKELSTNDETVSDILDELFNVEEDFIENSEAIVEKPIINELPSSVHDNDVNNMQTIEDNSIEKIPPAEDSSDIEIIDDSTFVDSPVSSSVKKDDVRIIYEEGDSELSLSNDFEVIDENIPDQLDNNEEMIIIEHSEDVDLIPDNIDSSNEEKDNNVQKVIVDYDENDKPVYSYITPVNQDEIEDLSSEIEPIEDDLSENDADIKRDDDINSLVNEDKINNTHISDSSKSEDDIVYNNDNSNSDICIGDVDSNEDEVQDKTESNQKYQDDDSQNIKYDNDVEEYEEYQDDDSQNIKYDNDVKEYKENQDDDSQNVQYDNDVEEYEEYQDDDSDDIQEYGEDDYEEDEEDDTIPEEKISKGSSKVALVILSIVVLVCLIGGGALFLLKNKSSKEISNTNNQGENNAIEVQNQQLANDMFEQPIESDTNIGMSNNLNTESNTEPANVGTSIDDNSIPASGTINVPQLTENDLIKPQERQSHGDVNKAIANAFAQGGNGISLRGLNWFCTSELFSNRSFKNYLQNLDNNLKQNLKNNILNATQMPPKDSVTAKFAVDNNGNLQKVIISETSGSDEIDNIVLQSIKESFEVEKGTILSDSEQKTDMYYLKVVIKL